MPFKRSKGDVLHRRYIHRPMNDDISVCIFGSYDNLYSS